MPCPEDIRPRDSAGVVGTGLFIGFGECVALADKPGSVLHFVRYIDLGHGSHVAAM